MRISRTERQIVISINLPEDHLQNSMTMLVKGSQVVASSRETMEDKLTLMICKMMFQTMKKMFCNPLRTRTTNLCITTNTANLDTMYCRVLMDKMLSMKVKMRTGLKDKRIDQDLTTSSCQTTQKMVKVIEAILRSNKKVKFCISLT